MKYKNLNVLKKYTDFKKIYTSGKKFYSNGIVVYFFKNSDETQHAKLVDISKNNSMGQTIVTYSNNANNISNLSTALNEMNCDNNSLSKSSLFRYAIAISKKFGKATKRNKLKRQIKDIIRKSSLKPVGYDIVFHISKSFTPKKYKEIEKIINEIFFKIQRMAQLTS